MEDGSDWSVLPNWEATKGIVNDILSVSYVPPNIHPLESRFASDLFFEPIVKHLLGHDAGSTPAARRKAMHQASSFTILDNTLWKISSKSSDRVAKTECIPAALGFAQALEAQQTWRWPPWLKEEMNQTKKLELTSRQHLTEAERKLKHSSRNADYTCR